MCEVAIPNKEIAYVYSKEILLKLENLILSSMAVSIQEAIYTKDIQMLPLDKKLPGVLIELKASKNCREEELSRLAEAALEQINIISYETDMQMKGVKEILKYGIAFSGKNVSVKVQVDKR